MAPTLLSTTVARSKLRIVDIAMTRLVAAGIDNRRMRMGQEHGTKRRFGERSVFTSALESAVIWTVGGALTTAEDRCRFNWLNLSISFHPPLQGGIA